MRAAVIGVGNMGSAIANRLLDVGASVTLNTRTPSKCAALIERGATHLGSAREAAETADFVILSLNSADIVERAVFGEEGVSAAANPAKLLVDFSSIDPARTAALATRLLEGTGMGWVDSPLSGGAPAALNGQLVLMVGGADEHVARAQPLFDRLARRATHLGASGAGQTVKLINQVLCASGFLAVAEAVRFAEAAGVDAARVPEALAGGRADSRILQEFMAKFARRDYSPTGRIGNMLKDLQAVEAVTSARSLSLPITEAISALHRLAVAEGLGDADNTAYLDLLQLAQTKGNA